MMGMKFRIECYNQGLDDWILYAFAKTENDARQKMSMAILKTQHTAVRMTEVA